MVSVCDCEGFLTGGFGRKTGIEAGNHGIMTGRLVSMAYPSGAVVEYGYDTAGQTTGGNKGSEYISLSAIRSTKARRERSGNKVL